jgi:peptidoglycan/LPS O-acetylase OafA/YrhL
MKKNLNTLTTFRFLAAFGVFLHHLNQLSFGPLGVTFFFVLSGFILTYSYYEKAQQMNKNGIISFYIARIGRIYPVALLTFLISIPLVFNEYSRDVFTFIAKAVAQLLLLQSYIPDSGVYYSFNGVAWSISTEMFFYMMFPFILKLLFRMKDYPRFYYALLVSIVTLEFIIGWVLSNDIQDLNQAYWFIYISPFFRILDFLLGCSVAFIFLLKPLGKKSTAFYTAIEFLSIVLMVFVYINVSHVPGSMTYGVVFIPFIAFMIFVFAHEKGLLSKLLQTKTLVYLGEVSFSFYMIHQLVFRYFWGKLHLSPPLLIGYFSVFTITIISSCLVYSYFEKPLRDFIRNHLANKVMMRRGAH